MGGRGSSSGFSIGNDGSLINKYGTQYHTVHQHENIKFVQKNKRQSESLMETMTEGRIYAEVGGNRIIRIIQFDERNKRNKVIELDKRTGKWHVHNGYEHTEYSEEHRDPLNDEDNELLDRVRYIWSNRR